MKRIDFENGKITGNILNGGCSDACGSDINTFV